MLLRAIVSLFLAFSVLALNGCLPVQGKIVTEEQLAPIKSNQAYIVIGEEIGEGNLVRMAVSLHMNGKLKKSKGIQLPDVISYWMTDMQRGYFHMEFKQLSSGRSGYRVWVIPENDIRAGGRSIVYIHSVSTARHHFTPTDMSKPFLNPSFFVPLEFASQGPDFYGNAFVVDRPGVYYLGDLKISGEMDKETYRSKHFQTLSWEVTNQGDIGSVEVYLESKGMGDMPFYDLSGAWQNIPTEKLLGYKRGELDFEYAQPK